MPLQQSPEVVHTCPYSAQGGPPSGAASPGGGGVTSSGGGVTSSGGGMASSGGGIETSGGVEPSGVPLSGGGTGGVPQMPRVEPGGMVQGSPGQQSAVVVHAPPLPTQIPPHTNGGKLLPGV